jgi:hypothetical protein
MQYVNPLTRRQDPNKDEWVDGNVVQIFKNSNAKSMTSLSLSHDSKRLVVSCANHTIIECYELNSYRNKNWSEKDKI